jgi:hypothetical protein
MNTKLPPIDPLDPDVRELARILRALPGGDPPAALDARILRAAHDAVAAQSSPRRRALWAGGSTGALWGIGSAAAAILAVGIGWKLTVPPDSNLPVPRSMPAAADSASDQAATPVEFTPMPERRQDAAAPPPPPAPVLKEETRRRVAMPPARPAPQPQPAPFPQTQAEEIHEAAPARSAAAAVDSTGFLGGAAAPAPAAAPRAEAEPRDAREAYSGRQRDEVLDRLSSNAAKASAPAGPATGVGEREAAAEATLADMDTVVEDKQVEADATLAPAAWLERIRARAKTGDADGARASLRLFVQRHPQTAIPVDLRPLLGE